MALMLSTMSFSFLHRLVFNLGKLNALNAHGDI